MRETVEEPRRMAIRMDEERLLKLERFPRRQDLPVDVSLDDIIVLDALFQPRGFSLTMNPGASRKHVETMARAVSRGGALDPLVIAAFGEKWVLIDGHHRRAAYKQAGHANPIRVAVVESTLGGLQRVRWAVGLSVALNSKNKLAMSAEDKFDAAWRLVVDSEELSKKEISAVTHVSDGTVAKMRRVSLALRAAGHRPLPLRAMRWGSARYEYKALHGSMGDNADGQERRLRLLTKGLSRLITRSLPAALLLEAMEALRPGISFDLELAIEEAKQLEADG